MKKEKAVSYPHSVVAVIPAAGSGVRMGLDTPKQFMDLLGKPLLALTLLPFQHCRAVDAVILVAPAGELDFCRENIVRKHALDKVKVVVSGGARRQDSVRLGLEATEGAFDRVLIHDGVRPLLCPDFLTCMIKEGENHRALVTGYPAKDTIKEATKDRDVIRTLDRRRLWMIQTPQLFRFDDLMEAHHKALRENWEEATDDALLLEQMGIPVKIIEGPEENIKVTTPHDLETVRYLMRKEASATPLKGVDKSPSEL